MHAAVNKLKKDIWKDEIDEKDHSQPSLFGRPRHFKVEPRKRIRGRVVARRTENTEKTTENDSKVEPDGAKPADAESVEKKSVEEVKVRKPINLKSLQEALEPSQPRTQIRQQTKMSRIRRSIFQLPESSPYTQYYSPEGEEAQKSASPQKEVKEKPSVDKNITGSETSNSTKSEPESRSPNASKSQPGRTRMTGSRSRPTAKPL